MIVIAGLVILVAAVIAGVASVRANGGHAHEVTYFAVFGARRTSRRGREAPPCCRSMEEPSWPSLA